MKILAVGPWEGIESLCLYRKSLFLLLLAGGTIVDASASCEQKNRHLVRSKKPKLMHTISLPILFWAQVRRVI